MEQKKCQQCGEEFTVTDKDLAFLDKVSPEFGGKKYQIPATDFCSECGMQRRLSFRNIRTIYKRKCDYSGEDIVSAIAPNSQFKVWHVKYFNSDVYDPLQYGRDFDFSRPFFDQFRELQLSVPRPHMAGNYDSLENAEFVNGVTGLKNAYLAFSTDYAEDVYYVDQTYHTKKCVDCLLTRDSEYCYECVECLGLNQAFFCQNCNNSHEIYFCRDLHGCQNCFGCVDLKNKQYYLFNESKTKEEFEQFMVEFKFLPDKIDWAKQKLMELYLQRPYKYAQIVNSENSSGDSLENCKNAQNCFDCNNAENVKNCFFLIIGARDAQEISAFGNNMELCYYGTSNGENAYHNLFCNYAFINVKELIYCDHCYNGASHMFGSVGVRRNEYCILNKKYSPVEYEKMVIRIIEHMQKTGEWGQYFPYSLSVFGYNDSTSQEYFPLTKEQAIRIGANWQDKDFGLKYDGPFYAPKEIVDYDPKRNPDAQKEIDELLKGIIKCEVTGKPFKIISQELAFYIEHGLPIPTKHPNQRYKERFAQRRPRKLWHRQCMCEGKLTINNEQLIAGGCSHQGRCTNEFETTYAPEREEKVYCEECYQKSVI